MNEAMVSRISSFGLQQGKIQLKNLFRGEVFDAQSENSLGESIKIRPFEFSLYVYSAVVFVVIVVIFISLSSYTRKHTVQGVLLPSGGAINIQSARDGVVSNIWFEEGTLVNAGEPVLTLSSSEWTASGVEASEQQLVQLENQRSWLEERLQNIDQGFEVEKKELGFKQQTIENNLRLLSQQKKIQQERLENINIRLKDKKGPLRKGLISKDEYAREYERYFVAIETFHKIDADIKEQNTQLT